MKIAVAIVLVALTLAGTASSGSLTRDQRLSRAEIVRVFGNDATALRVAWCESHWQRKSWSGADSGVFQINYSAHHHSGESVSAFRAKFENRRTNVAFAWRLSRHGTNWNPWTCY